MGKTNETKLNGNAALNEKATTAAAEKDSSARRFLEQIRSRLEMAETLAEWCEVRRRSFPRYSETERLLYEAMASLGASVVSLEALEQEVECWVDGEPSSFPEEPKAIKVEGVLEVPDGTLSTQATIKEQQAPKKSIGIEDVLNAFQPNDEQMERFRKLVGWPAPIQAAVDVVEVARARAAVTKEVLDFVHKIRVTGRSHATPRGDALEWLTGVLEDVLVAEKAVRS